MRLAGNALVLMWFDMIGLAWLGLGVVGLDFMRLACN